MGNDYTAEKIPSYRGSFCKDVSGHFEMVARECNYTGYVTGA